MGDYDLFEDDLFQDEDDITSVEDIRNLVVYSRDWTIQTIYDQIEQGNIDLNPGFQRRNAWNDSKRSKLIESLLIGYPVPEIVLAEDKKKKKAFIVIDGKQRLLTIAGYINNEKYQYWKSKIPKLTTVNCGADYHGMDYKSIQTDTDLKRMFENASLRCTVISNYSKDDELYDIFYRLNAGSTPLATQELRQALYRGDFSNYLIEITNEDNIFRKVMGLKDADNRLRDVEVILRCMAFLKFANQYKGNLLKFLDKVMDYYNKKWQEDADAIKSCKENVENAIKLLSDAFGSLDNVGRKFKNALFESRFNRVLLEVEVHYFSKLDKDSISPDQHARFVKLFQNLCDKDPQFLASLEGSTKNLENYIIRYTKFQRIVEESYNVNLGICPFGNEQG